MIARNIKALPIFGTSNMKTNNEEGFIVCYIVINGVVIEVKDESEKYELLRSYREEAAD